MRLEERLERYRNATYNLAVALGLDPDLIVDDAIPPVFKYRDGKHVWQYRQATNPLEVDADYVVTYEREVVVPMHLYTEYCKAIETPQETA